MGHLYHGYVSHNQRVHKRNKDLMDWLLGEVLTGNHPSHRRGALRIPSGCHKLGKLGRKLGSILYISRCPSSIAFSWGLHYYNKYRTELVDISNYM